MKTHDLILDRYQLQVLHAQREHTQTWEALDQQTQTPVIVKVLNLTQTEDWHAYTLFEREVEALKSLQHPRIPRLIAFAQENGQAIVVQEKIIGETLRERMERRWKVSETQARQLIVQALEVLTAVHSAQLPLIHRDLKPENLMLDANDQLYIIDFGAVRQQQGTAQHTVAGSFAYMAPEQLSGQASPASDLYALGMTWIELLSGSPLQSIPRQGLYLQFQEALHVSQGFKRWLEHMVAPYPAQRFVSATEALKALNQAEHLPEVEHRTTVRASHGKQELTPAIWLEETPTTLSVEIKGNAASGSLLAQLGLFMVSCLGWYAGLFFSSTWLLDFFWSTQLGADSDVVAIILVSIVAPLLCIATYRRWFGQLAEHQQLTVDGDHLTHTYILRRGIWGSKKIQYRYPLKNLREIRMKPYQMQLRFLRLQRGFWDHRVTLQVPFSVETRQTLADALNTKGVHTRV